MEIEKITKNNDIFNKFDSTQEKKNRNCQQFR